MLGIDTGEQRTDRRQLVAPDTAVDDCLRASLGIEGPAPLVLAEWDRHRPIVRADVQLRAPGALLIDRVLLIVESNKALMQFPVGVLVTGVEDAVGVGPEDGAQIGLLVVAQGCDKCRHRFLGRRETALGSGCVH